MKRMKASHFKLVHSTMDQALIQMVFSQDLVKLVVGDQSILATLSHYIAVEDHSFFDPEEPRGHPHRSGSHSASPHDERPSSCPPDVNSSPLQPAMQRKRKQSNGMNSLEVEYFSSIDGDDGLVHITLTINSQSQLILAFRSSTSSLLTITGTYSDQQNCSDV
jgi:hypothetical protein